MPDTPQTSAAVRCIHCGKKGTHRVCDECFKTQGSAAQKTPPPAATGGGSTPRLASDESDSHTTPGPAAVGLDGEPCRSRSDNCPHFMFARCPGCHREMYAPAVWDFSHGDVACQCGTSVEPAIRPRRQEAPEWTI